jgi:hypothetical protein
MAYPFRLSLLTSCVTAVFCPGQDFLHGTASATIRTPTVIVIAADSRVIDGEGNQAEDTCKIRQVRTYVFSAHGLANSDGFDVFDVVSKILDRPGDLSSKSLLIRDAIVPSLTEVMQRDAMVRRNSTGVIIFGLEDGRLHLSYVKFMPAQETTGRYYAKPELHECPAECSPDGIAFVSVSPENTPFTGGTDPLSAVQAFVQSEIDAGAARERGTGKAAEVAGPIQVLTMRLDGNAEWIERPSVCRK